MTQTQTANEYGLPDGFRYEGYATDATYRRAVVEVWPKDGPYRGEPLFKVHFVPLIPFGKVSLPKNGMIERVDASTFSCDIDMDHIMWWVQEACELYGGLPVHLDTWDRELSFFQGRWVDRETGEPLKLEEVA